MYYTFDNLYYVTIYLYTIHMVSNYGNFMEIF
jgi:hypothetical protein